MCENKKKCSCGCSTKKTITESKQIIKEGTWAPTIWDDNVALQAKNILRGMIDTSDSVDISKLINRFQKKFYNKIGDDILYDHLDQASSNFSRGFPNWKNDIEYAIQRIDQLERTYKEKGKTSDHTFKVNETTESKNNLPKKPKYKLHCEHCNSDFGANFKKAACPKCGKISTEVLNENKLIKSKLLEKINLKLTSSAKIDMVKQTKIALDAMYSLYISIERKDIEHEVFLDMVDKTFENISELLAVLISQESIEIKK